MRKYFQVGQSDYEKGVKAAKIFFTEEEVRKVKVRRPVVLRGFRSVLGSEAEILTPRPLSHKQAVGRLPGLKLLGFVPRQGNLHFWQSVKQSYFIYPEEDVSATVSSRFSTTELS